VVVNGLAAQVTIAGAEGGKDSLVIDGLSGNDSINASALNPGQINLTINGGAGNDTITGSRGSDLVTGGTGNDVALLGAGDDTFVWNPGDGSDTVEGQAGTDTLRFNGANLDEKIDISANGSRARLSRDVGNVTMDLKGVEHIEVNALGGADTITVNDLTGTDVNQVTIDLGAQPGTAGGDGQADTIVINATNGDDAITITNNNGVITVSGLPEAVTISNFEAANDRIVINGLGGDDVITASGLTGILFTANGGDGNDILIGSPGNDILTGGNGDDVLIGGGGQGRPRRRARQQHRDCIRHRRHAHQHRRRCGGKRWLGRRGCRPARPVRGIELRRRGRCTRYDADHRSAVEPAAAVDAAARLNPA